MDLILASGVDVEVSIGDSLVDEVDKYHPPLNVQLSVQKRDRSKTIKDSGPQRKPPVFSYAVADFEKIYNAIKCCSWTDLYTIQDPNDAAEYFQRTMNELVLPFVPTKVNDNIGKNYSPWFTADSIKTLKAKERERRELRGKKRSQVNDRTYRQLRTLSEKMIEAAYKTYILQTEGHMTKNPRAFWNFIKSKKDLLKKYKGKSLCNPGEISDAFAEYFSSVHVSDTTAHPAPPPTPLNSDMTKLHLISTERVSEAIKKLKPKRSLGPDNIPAYIYESCGEYLIEPLTYIFNRCITSCTFPTVWKITKITPFLRPIPKKTYRNTDL